MNNAWRCNLDVCCMCFACMEVPCVMIKALFVCYKKMNNVTVN